MIFLLNSAWKGIEEHPNENEIIPRSTLRHSPHIRLICLLLRRLIDHVIVDGLKRPFPLPLPAEAPGMDVHEPPNSTGLGLRRDDLEILRPILDARPHKDRPTLDAHLSGQIPRLDGRMILVKETTVA